MTIIAAMKVRKFKILVVALFLTVFSIKIGISIAPALLCLDSKTITLAVLQLTQESKTDKDDPEKESFKDKKFFDEFIVNNLAFQSYLSETEALHNSEHCLFKQQYHPVVPTPPPNV